MAINLPETVNVRDRWGSLAEELGLPPEPNLSSAPPVAEEFLETNHAAARASIVAEASRSAEAGDAVSWPIAVQPITPAVQEAEFRPIAVRRITSPIVASPPVSVLPSAKHYATLFRKYRGQPVNEIFASYVGQNWEEPYDRLASLAKKEDWQFVRPEFRQAGVNFPILKEYLKNTFLRLQEQGRIRYSTDGDNACFNSGLQTPDEKDIFALFRRAPVGAGEPQQDWEFKDFYDSYSRELSKFRPLEDLEIATYYQDASDLVLDITYEIDINIAHILDDPQNHGRLPQKLRGERNMAMLAIEGATKFLKQKVMRNYRTAIPQWYFPDQKIQLLLPLCIMNPSAADLALVADKDKAGRVYRIRTALSMDMAYINARLITRPEREWLNP